MSGEEHTRLRRDVGLGGAVLLGLGSIIGTGVFVSLGLAVESAGSAVVLAVLIAAGVALCNGLSSAQLAAAHPVAGGTYEYGYKYVHPVAGLAAGWLFLVAKSASAATAALGIAAYVGVGAGRLPALLALAAVTMLVLAGIRRSNQLNMMVVAVSVGALTSVIVTAWGEAAATSPMPFAGTAGLIEAAALVFVAFTGYGRVATLGEEVSNPRRTIPIAVMVTVAVSALIYAGVAFVLARLAPEGLGEGSPLIPIGQAVGGDGLAGLVRLGALAAMVGVLLNLVLGLSRVALAMGRRSDLPGMMARIYRDGRSPTPAVLAVAGLIALFVLIGDIRVTWSFSALTVLLYYAITNIAALRQPASEQRMPAAVPLLGLVGCLGLAVFIDPRMWAAAAVLGVAGLVWQRFRPQPEVSN